MDNNKIIKLQSNLYLLKGENGGSHRYLIRGDYKNVLIDSGLDKNFILEIIHTPGHTSGSICIYEVNQNLLFTGDTVFAKGTLSYISESGSIGDYINSIGRLATMKVKAILPGHGDISKTPDEDMKKAIANAHGLLKNQIGIEIADRKVPAIAQK